MHYVIFRIPIYRHIAPLHSASQRLDNVAVFRHEYRRMIPSRVDAVGTGVAQRLSKANQFARPTVSMGQQEIAARRILHFLPRRKLVDHCEVNSLWWIREHGGPPARSPSSIKA